MHLNKVLSQPLFVTPLKDGEIAEFRLMGSDKINPKTKEPMRAAGLSLPGITNIIDLHDSGKSKLIQNVVSWRQKKKKDGSIREEAVIDRIRFGKTNSLKLTVRQNETYGFMMRHNACANNPFRDKGATPLYYLVNPREKAMKIIQDEDLALDARIMVRNGTPTELFALAANLGLDAEKDSEVVRAKLIERAKVAPLAIIGASTDAEMKSKLRVREAVELNFVDFETKERVWFWADDPKHPVIVVVPDNQDPLKFIVGFVQQEDGRVFYNQLLKKLKSFDNKLNGS